MSRPGKRDPLGDEFIKAFRQELPPITSAEERDVLAGWLAVLDEAADKLTINLRLRMAFRQQAVVVQDRIDEYDAREDDQSS